MDLNQITIMCISIYVKHLYCEEQSKACAWKVPKFRPCGMQCAIPWIDEIERRCCCSQECCEAALAQFRYVCEQRDLEQLNWTGENIKACLAEGVNPFTDVQHQWGLKVVNDARRKALDQLRNQEIKHNSCADIRAWPLRMLIK